MPRNLWNDDDARAAPALDGAVYRARLLGADRSIVTIYGGTISAKLPETDHMGRPTDVLWVKGSGVDLASIDERGFAGLRLAELLPLVEREAMSDEEMAAYLARTVFAPDRPRQSIETLLHAFIPARHVDHTHPDAVISLACAERGPELVRELWGERALWVGYTRPGFALSKWIGEGLRASPRAELVVMAKHGLATWGDTSRACYERTVRLVSEAEEFIAARRAGRRVFAGAPAPAPGARDLLAGALPVLRGAISHERPAVLLLDQSPEVMAFVNSPEAAALSQVGPACPDHLIHTRRTPLFVAWQPEQGADALARRLAVAVNDYSGRYAAYVHQHAGPGDRAADPHPRVVLIPGLGMVTAGPDAQAADVSRQLYRRAISVIEGSQAVDRFTSLTPAESFAVEYWPLEQNGLRPPPRELAGTVAAVTGGASGIGRAVARRLAADGAHVVILDVDHQRAGELAHELCERHGERRAVSVACDVTDEGSVAAAFAEIALAYGGLDILVACAGIALSAPVEQTTVEMWDRTFEVLARGYFLASRAALRLWRQQRIGGSLVFIASKDSVAAGRNNAAYSAAKAAELHLARCLAEEGGPIGVRVNSVLPDAVLKGSAIWESGWRAARAASYGIAPEDLDEYYRQRSVLKVNIFPEDVAEAVAFLAGPRAAHITGAALSVDGGITSGYVR